MSFLNSILDLSISNVLTAGDLLKEQKLCDFKCSMENVLDSSRPLVENAPEEILGKTVWSETVAAYLGNGYLKNVYNAELCDNQWLIMIYLINRLYDNFATSEKIKIKSLHLNCLPGSELASIHHLLRNSKVSAACRIEWEWVGTVDAHTNEVHYDVYRKIKRKYRDNLLHLLSTEISDINNINYIVNETLNRLGRIGLICVGNEKDSSPTLCDFMAYAVLSIKLLDSGGICHVNIDDPKVWGIDTLSGVIMLGLIFQDMHMYKFDSDGIQHTVLIYRRKKKLSSEVLYKKLINLLDGPFTKSYNLFTAEYLRSIIKSNTALHDLLYGNNFAPIISCADIIQEIDSILEMNVNMFL